MRLIVSGCLLIACGGAPEAVSAKQPTVAVAPAEEKPGSEPETSTGSALEPERSRKQECKAPGTDEALKKAKMLFQEAVELYERGEYVAAGSVFGESYELSCNPLLLYNMARCYEKTGDFRGAVEAYERYLDGSSPDALHVEETKRVLEELKKKL